MRGDDQREGGPAAVPARPAGLTSRGAATAARLRAAARDVFAEVGFAAARVEDVVARAGVSHGTFYTYYDNKAAVLDALVDDTASALQAVVDEPWEGTHVATTVEEVIGRFANVFASQGDVIRVWLEASAYERHFRERLRQVRDGYVARVADHLAPLTRDTDHDPVVAASALVAMVEGYATQRDQEGARDADRADVRTLAAIWFGGLQALAAPVDRADPA